jgi:hypothetical protein
MINDKRLEKKEIAIDYLSHFPFYKWAAKRIGIHEDTMVLWKKEDKDFSDRCEAARSECISKMGKRATPDFMLKSVDPKTFKERLDITSGDKPIPILSGIMKDEISTDNSA